MKKFSSPGRIEIIGNHTDHNFGKVIVAAIDLKTFADAEKTSDNIIRIASEGYKPFTVSLSDTSQIPSYNPAALVTGVANGLIKRGYKIGGFNAKIKSTVPKGAGVSSSASFEVLIAKILNDFYNDGNIDRLTMAMIAQYAENVYMKKPCGLLDQTGVAFGGLTFVDFGEKNITPKTLNLKNDDYTIVIVNTGDHSGLTEHYAYIKSEMQDVSKFFNKNYLNEVSSADFYNAIGQLKKKLSGRAILRAAHFFEENERVNRAVTAIENQDLETFFRLMKKSGESSYKLLQNCYAPENLSQEIPLALYLSEKLITKGAYRVHGGGFAGTILAFVHKSEFDVYVTKMTNVFGKKNIIVTKISPEGVE